jgi:hypothetical protein
MRRQRIEELLVSHGRAPGSGAVGDTLAEQALRAQRQHEDQHDEREDVLVVAAEDAAGQRPM